MTYHKYSGLFVFTKNGDEDNLYRGGITESEAEILNRIKDHEMMLPFEKTNDTMTIGRNEIIERPVYRIPKLPYEIRIQDLTKKQAKKLLLDLINFIIYCLNKNVVIWDISESNVLYWNKKTYFVDLDAFSDITNKQKNMLYSFVKMSYLYYRYLADNDMLTSAEQADHKTVRKYSDWTNKQIDRNLNNIKTWKEFKDIIYNTNCSPKNSHWADEYAHDDTKLKQNKKLKIVKSLLEPTYGGTVLDIGTNKGYYLDIIKKNYKTLIGFDIDSKCVNIAEEKYGSDKIGFVNLKINDFFSGTRLSDSRICRYKSDLVMALAVTHHFKNSKVDANKAAQAIADCSNKWILIEDIEQQFIYNTTFENNKFKLYKSIDSNPRGRKLSLWIKD